jgi:hypothetical protein
MGEYVKYKGEEIKIGTMENLYYVSHDKYTQALEAGKLTQAPGSLAPEEYLKIESGSRFRFPFPDEDKLPFGDIIGPHNRSVPITISGKIILLEGSGKDYHTLEIIWQKPVIRESDGKSFLALVLQDPHSGDRFRIEDDEKIRALAAQIMLHDVVNEADQAKREFYASIVSRTLSGYGITEFMDYKSIVHPAKYPLYKKIRSNRKKRPGKGI